MATRQMGGRLLTVFVKAIAGVLILFGALVTYFAYTTTATIIDPRWVAPVGVFMILIGGFMLIVKPT